VQEQLFVVGEEVAAHFKPIGLLLLLVASSQIGMISPT